MAIPSEPVGPTGDDADPRPTDVSTISEGGAASEDKHDVRFDGPEPELPGLPTRGMVIDGRYKILERIGRGGMGVVFLAAQQTPVQRRVALKIIRVGLASTTAQVRFQQERQVLAFLDHSNIAKVYDGGVTDLGFPYFVMEHVKGVPLTDYCTDRRLGLKDRLHLFERLCLAVQHAHQRGIIHRDLKPSNILVAEQDDAPVVKVIDFGVAKVTHGPLVGGTIHTDKGSLVGTLEYMAPEQAGTDQLDVDTRADIYSLGVVLYELLTGTPPFTRKELRETTLDEAIRIIRSVEPLRPSARLTRITREQAAEEHPVHRPFPGPDIKAACHELDWVVMRCLEKDRNRRFAQMSELVEEVRRFLDDRPLQSRPPSWNYRIRKFVARHRAKVAAVTFAFLALVISLVVMTISLLQAVAANRAAKEENEIHKSLFAFISTDLFSPLDVQQRLVLGLPPDRDLKVRTLLDRAASEIGNGQFASQPRSEASLRLTIGKGYASLGLVDEAERQLKRALDLRTTVHGADHPATYEALHALANTQRPLDAVKTLDRVCDAFARFYGPNASRTLDALYDLCWAEFQCKQIASAESRVSDLLARQKDLFAADQIESLQTRELLAQILQHKNDLVGAAREFGAIRSAGVARHGAGHPVVMMLTNNYAQCLRKQRKNEEARGLYEQLLPAAETVYDDHHPILAVYRANYAALLIRMRQYREAERLLTPAIDVFVKQLGQRDKTTLIAESNFAALTARQGNHPRAVAEYSRLKPLFLERFGLNSDETEGVLAPLCDSYVALGEFDKAIATAKEYFNCVAAQGVTAVTAPMKKRIADLEALAARKPGGLPVNPVLNELIESLPSQSPLREALSASRQ